MFNEIKKSRSSDFEVWTNELIKLLKFLGNIECEDEGTTITQKSHYRIRDLSGYIVLLKFVCYSSQCFIPP